MVQSTHQPFEEWIFSRDVISPEDELALQDHLRHCPDCQARAGAMQKVEFSLRAAPVLPPTAGFASRWQDRLVEHRLRRQRVQTAIFLMVIFTIAAILAVLFALLLQPALRSPYPYLLAVAYQLASAWFFMNRFASAGITVSRTIFKIIPPAIWVSFVFALAAAVAIWLAALRKLVYPRRMRS